MKRKTRLSIAAVIGASLLIPATMPASAGVQASDLLLYNTVSSNTIGEDIIDETPPSTQIVRMRRQGAGGYGDISVGMQNQSGSQDDFTLTGCPSNAKVKVSYWLNANDITAEVISGHLSDNQDPGVNYWIDIHAKLTKRGAKHGGVAWTCDFGMVSANTNSTDTARVQYKVKRP